MEGLSVITIVACLVGGYLIGSIPFGVIITRLAGEGDIRQIGSGNIGATNVLRTGRKGLALLTLIGDGGKGAVAAIVAWNLANHSAAALAGGAAFVGHLFPVWLGFRGGKGVATFFGVLFAAAWPVGFAGAVVWIGVFLASRISSLSALSAASVVFVLAFVLRSPPVLLGVIVVMCVLIFVRHQANIRRLLKREEPRFASRRTRPDGVA